MRPVLQFAAFASSAIARRGFGPIWRVRAALSPLGNFAMTVAPAAPGSRAGVGDLGAIAICTLAWGTTWYAITHQLGVVDPVVSITYRFGLAAALLFAWCALRGEKMGLTRQQHLAAMGVGLFTFAIDYAFVYWAEERVTSAVVAVVFASMAFANLITFRIAFGQRAAPIAWLAAGAGVLGVALLSWEELVSAGMSARAWEGIAFTFIAVLAATTGNVFARRGEIAGASVAGSTAWAMAYGAALLAVFALATGREWAFAFTWPYVLSLLHLAILGSVVAFVLYYGLARRRGYSTASYIAALIPLVAMVVSALFEAKVWGPMALAGAALVLGGQVLLLRVKSAS